MVLNVGTHNRGWRTDTPITINDGCLARPFKPNITLRLGITYQLALSLILTVLSRLLVSQLHCLTLVNVPGPELIALKILVPEPPSQRNLHRSCSDLEAPLTESA